MKTVILVIMFAVLGVQSYAWYIAYENLNYAKAKRCEYISGFRLGPAEMVQEYRDLDCAKRLTPK